MLLYPFLVFFLIDTTNKQFVWFHLINFLNYYLPLLVQELLVIFTAFVSELITSSFEWSKYKKPVPLVFIGNILFSKTSRTFSLPSKNAHKFLRISSFSCFFFGSCGFGLSLNSWFQLISFFDLHQLHLK